MISPPNMSLLLIMVCFWAVFWLVSALLVRPLGKVLDERERRLASARETLTTAEQTSQETLSRCERELSAAAAEAQRVRASLRAAGETTRRARLEAARGQGQERLAALARDIEQAAGAARGELRRRAEELATTLAERLLGRRLVQ